MLVLLERQADQLGAVRVAALAEERRQPAYVELLPLALQLLVRLAEDDLVARGALLALSRRLVVSRHHVEIFASGIETNTCRSAERSLSSRRDVAPRLTRVSPRAACLLGGAPHSRSCRRVFGAHLMYAVEVDNLRKEFVRREKVVRVRRRVALEDVSFTMERGECVAILGQNGSGKSTLVRLLATLLLPDGGTAHVFGHDVFAEPRKVQRLVNRVSVEASFFKKMSAAENLAYAARFYGMGPRETHVKIPIILGRVGFPPSRRGEAMENLSRGMQQKVALARALLTSPVLLLLDEPTTGLDPRSKQEVQTFIREIRERHDSTILLCTHDMKEAEDLADRVGLLDRGELLFIEPVEDVKERYGVDTLEEAFFAATGRTYEDEKTEDDEEREVFA